MLIGAISPFLLKTADNPEGVDGEVFEGIKAGSKFPAASVRRVCFRKPIVRN